MTARVLTLTVYIASLFLMSVPVALGQKQEARSLSSRKRMLDQQLDLTLDNIEGSCSLTDAQRSRLKLAAKGAVAASMQKYKAVLNKLRKKVKFAEDDEFEGLWWDDVVVGEAPIPYKTLAFLSKRQLAEWKRSCEPALGQIEEAEFEVIPFDQLVRDILPPIMWRNMGVEPELTPVETEPGEAN